MIEAIEVLRIHPIPECVSLVHENVKFWEMFLVGREFSAKEPLALAWIIGSGGYFCPGLTFLNFSVRQFAMTGWLGLSIRCKMP